ncbi:nitrate ABC transporter substrate-binding protein [Acetobacter aceti 1023]|nr:nitrate ABC transporter substrate-binding protein [Acetobacter aceti 1023]
MNGANRYGGIMRRVFLRIMLVISLFFVGLTQQARAGTPVRIGYIPVLGSSALFVLDGEGWAKQAGLDLQLVRFGSGPQAIQALVSGRIDAYVAGVLPLLQARAHGVDVKVVASGSVEELELVARGPLAQIVPEGQEGGLSAQAIKDGLAKFNQEQGHLPRVAVQPAGSVPDIMLRYWFEKRLDIAQPASVVNIAGVDIDAAQQAFLAGAVDAAMLREPSLTVAKMRVPDARILATGHDMMPDQPGSVLAIVKPAEVPWAKALTGLFVKANTLVAEHPDEAAPFVRTALGGGMLKEEVLQKALARSAKRFVSDPARIVEGVRQLQDFEVKQGLLRKAEPVDGLFDLEMWKQSQQ